MKPPFERDTVDTSKLAQDHSARVPFDRRSKKTGYVTVWNDACELKTVGDGSQSTAQNQS